MGNIRQCVMIEYVAMRGDDGCWNVKVAHNRKLHSDHPLYRSTVCRPGKNRQNGKLLVGKSCDLEGKNKEIPHGKREICPAGGKFCPACREINIFFQAWQYVSLKFVW